MGAGDSKLNLADLQLRDLNVKVGAGDATIDLTGNWNQDVTATLQGGVGDLRLKLPRGMSVRVTVQGGIGSVEAPDFKRNGSEYVNDAYAQGKPTINVSISGGIGDVHLELAGSPRGVVSLTYFAAHGAREFEVDVADAAGDADVDGGLALGVGVVHVFAAIALEVGRFHRTDPALHGDAHGPAARQLEAEVANAALKRRGDVLIPIAGEVDSGVAGADFHVEVTQLEVGEIELGIARAHFNGEFERNFIVEVQIPGVFRAAESGVMRFGLHDHERALSVVDAVTQVRLPFRNIVGDGAVAQFRGAAGNVDLARGHLQMRVDLLGAAGRHGDVFGLRFADALERAVSADEAAGHYERGKCGDGEDA